MRPLLRLAFVALVALNLTGCGTRHDVQGLVLKVDLPSRSIVVSHEPIPGFMNAMVMPFTAARAEDLAEVRAGDRIAFRMTVRGERTTIDTVRILSSKPSAGGSASSAAPLTEPGALVPDFTLTDQHAVPVSLSSLRGKVVVASFIYTRCPLPDYCPRVMTNFTTLRDRFADRLSRDLVLLTVTFDPKHDTPPKLREYAGRYGADVPGWHFLTGTSEEVGRVCASLGVEFYPEEGMITHSLQTAIIDRSGRLAASAEGREFSAKQLGDLVGEHLR